MATPLLINRADFTGRVELSANMADAKINNRILEAEDFDLCALMGDAFYYWFIAQTQIGSVPASITTLLTGGTYVVNGITYSFDGVKTVLVYYTTARLIKALDINFTPFGVTQKRNDFSDHIESKDISWRANQFINQGLAYWEKCVKYLDANNATYPLWRAGCGCGDDQAKPAARFSVLGGGEERGYGYPYINNY